MDKETKSELSGLRAALQHGENVTQAQLDDLCRAWELRIHLASPEESTYQEME